MTGVQTCALLILLDKNKQKEKLKEKPKSITLAYLAVELPKLEPDSDEGKSFKLSIRNKGKSYRHAFLRADLRNALDTLFIEQERLGNPFINVAIPDAKAPLKLEIGRESCRERVCQ